jgi:hypothetical protein
MFNFFQQFKLWHWKVFLLNFDWNNQNSYEIINLNRRIGKTHKKNEVVKCVKYLLNNRSADNDDTVQYLLDPRRYSGD